MLGTQAILEVLKSEGVDLVFAYPGGQVIPLFDAFHDETSIRLILPRHEQGGAHAADGYARATGKVGVVIATSGPGATNLVTGIANAYLDSVPMVAITGQVAANLIGNDAFQEVDFVGITKSITKKNYLVTDPQQLPAILKEAFHVARSGKPGPVVVDVPSSVQRAEVTAPIPASVPATPAATQAVDPDLAKRVAELVNASSRPLLYAGGGVISAGAADVLRQVAESSSLPVATTLMGLGSFPSDHAQNVGMVGMHGTYYANHAVMNCDLLLAVGVRFNDRVTGKLETFAPHATVIHVDIDPATLSRTVAVDVSVVGDVKAVLENVLPGLEKRDRSAWLGQINAWRNELTIEDAGPGLTPQFVLKEMARLSEDRDTVMVTDVGQHQMWTAQYWRHRRPRRFLSSGGLGTMGFGLPAAMGAQLGCPDSLVVCVSGDGGIQMNIQELATVQRLNLPVKIIILNNGYLGMVRQWQDILWNKRYAHTDISDNPDFLHIARAYGVKDFSITREDEAASVLEAAFAHQGPVVVDVRIEREINVLPMVPGGESLDNMILASPA
ncbi:MAG: biosynthetic-type acetolactate synthase large subunit [Planctomycetaceae bacterium]|nr:biosynthetic-type acetolactate synthase large subunit [Planctomycetaceae bacterium]